MIQSKEEISYFFIKGIILLLINEKESDKNLLISIFEKEIKDSDSLDGWECLEKVYSKLKMHDKVNECKIRQGEIYALYGDRMDDSIVKTHWYHKALEVSPNTKETKPKLEH